MSFFAKKSYALRLANGQSFNLVAYDETIPWLNFFAQILELKEGQTNSSPQIIFLDEEKTEDSSSFCSSYNFPINDWEFQGARLLKSWTNSKSGDVIFAIKTKDLPSDTSKTSTSRSVSYMLRSLQYVSSLVLQSGGMPFHCGLLEKDGKAVLVSAPGSTGKSTCCRRIPAPWTAHGDDASIIVHTSEAGYRVHPFPTWSDYLMRQSSKTWKTESHFPLRAIFFLEQADEDECIPIWSGQAALLINHQITQVSHPIHPQNEEQKIIFQKLKFKNACALAKKIPCFILRVNISGKFWEKIEAALKKYTEPMRKPPKEDEIKLYTPKLITLETSPLDLENRGRRRRLKPRQKKAIINDKVLVGGGGKNG
ncbi:MAG: SynChlorMet cassette protein ScmC [Candidatus Saganbacteria bacterium]|nr:SynChlorMet cassette protein ScmC [Candidatus Saganbacteria bacterium]